MPKYHNGKKVFCQGANQGRITLGKYFKVRGPFKITEYTLSFYFREAIANLQSKIGKRGQSGDLIVDGRGEKSIMIFGRYRLIS